MLILVFPPSSIQNTLKIGVFKLCAQRFPSIFFPRSLYDIWSLFCSLGFGVWFWFSLVLVLICNQNVWVAMATTASKLTLATEVINYIFSWWNTWSYNRDDIWIQDLKAWGLIISWYDEFPTLGCVIQKSCNCCQLRKSIFLIFISVNYSKAGILNNSGHLKPCLVCIAPSGIFTLHLWVVLLPP